MTYYVSYAVYSLSNGNNILQAIHFFYGVGAFVSPMIAQPFLLNEDCSSFISNSSEALFPDEENETLPAATLEEAQNMTHIDYAFFIMALTMVFSLSLYEGYC